MFSYWRNAYNSLYFIFIYVGNIMDDLSLALQIEYDKFLLDTPLKEWCSYEQFEAAWIYTSILFKTINYS